MDHKCGREELPHVQSQGQKPGGPHALGAAAKRRYPVSKVRGSGGVPGWDSTGAAERRYPTSKVRGGGRKEQPHVQGAVAARAQEGLEELSHVEGQEGGR